MFIYLFKRDIYLPFLHTSHNLSFPKRILRELFCSGIKNGVRIISDSGYEIPA